jgi:hypothetical protein
LAVIQILVVLPMAAAVWTVLTYLFNLPFMLLVFNSPFFLKRFQAVFGFEEGDRQEECRSPNSRRGCPFMAQDAIPVLGQKR